MEAPTDFQDWEFLSDSDSSASNSKPLFEDALGSVEPDDTAIRSDYFSLDPTAKPQPMPSEEGSASVDSDNPSWIDPDAGSHCVKNSRSFLSDASSDAAAAGERELDVEEEEMEDADDGGRDLTEKTLESEGERERVWWKMPVEILKLWVLRVRPVWTIPIAAAIVGVVMMGRRLYKMKQKSKSIPLKIAIDDKKASQFMTRVARLNEAFSVVKRVPIVRPSLAVGGVTSWPMVSLR